LSCILQNLPREGSACEIECGAGYASIWLSQRAVRAEGMGSDARALEYTSQVNGVLGGQASFRSGDPFDFFVEQAPRFDVVHHHGLLHRYAVPWIQALLAQQVARARKVVFSIPSVYLPHDPNTDERLLPIEEWQRILEPFQVLELRYFGDPRQDERDHILCVLQGQAVGEPLRQMMMVPAEPYPQGISAIVHTRNEAHHLEACLQTLVGWTDEIIVCDMESSDETLEIARRFTDQIIEHPRLINFDRARNVSAMRAKYRWVFYLDADERVPPETGQHVRNIALNGNGDFGALVMPFRNIYSGHWLNHIYPGYKAPQLFKNGKFFYNADLHTGAMVDGQAVLFPANDPNLALLHYSHDSIAHHLDKLNRYTDGESLNLWQSGQSFRWQDMVRQFVTDARFHYDIKNAPQDEGYGLIYALMAGFYRLIAHAKLYERRDHEGVLRPEERQVPPRLEDVFKYALELLREKPAATPKPLRVVTEAHQGTDADELPAADLVLNGPLLSSSNYGEQSRNQVFGLIEAGVPLAAQVLPCMGQEADLDAGERESLGRMEKTPLSPGFVQIVHGPAPEFKRHPQAGLAIGRTLFETDRLPVGWAEACNAMDGVWVFSEFNRRTFAAAGVAPDKLRVIPDSLNPVDFADLRTSPRLEAFRTNGQFVFLSVFDWTLHKGWDVLLEGFLRAFEGRDDVALVFKVWSSLGLRPEQVREQAAEWVRTHLGHDLLTDRRIHFLQDHLPRLEIRELLNSCDAYVLPSRGEGWGKPYMDAMACGKPTIATGWGGNTEFMTADNSYLVGFDLEDIPSAGWREVPHYKGHRWAQPRMTDLIEVLRRVVAEPAEAQAKGQRARKEVLSKFDRVQVARQLEEAIQQAREAKFSPAKPSQTDATLSANSKPSEEFEPFRLRWEGAPFCWHSLSHINRELSLALLDSGRVDLSLIPTEANQFSPTQDPRLARLESRIFAPLPGPGEVHMRHSYPPRLSPASEGHLVLMQHWEFGALPEGWIEPVRQSVDEVWCASRYVRQMFLESGIAPEKLQLMPLGANTSILHPSALPHVFTDEVGSQVFARGRGDRFVFLFVGGTIFRKGIDILLAAYQRAFSAYDEVCLVIKDTGTKTVYSQSNTRDEILGGIGDTSRPPIVYIDADLSERQLAGIYTASDCYVHPYRGEGFCMPVLEAMACGLPVIVTAGGPTNDFVDESVGWRVAAEKKPVGTYHQGRGRISDIDCVGPTWMFEVAVEDLARQMREAYRNRDEAKKRGENGAIRVREGWTWQHSARAVLKRLEVLRDREPLSLARARQSRSATVVIPSVTTPEKEKEATLQTEVSNSKRSETTISLCMIVRNEERVLGDCLASAKPWFDEIIVVDTGSTDRTVAIAQEHGARVFHFPWCDDFSAARNESLRHATGEWLFWMDADDTLPPESGRQLRDLAFLAETKMTGFIVQVQIPPPEGETGFTIVDHVKLFRNLPELRFIGRIHEQILEPIHRIGGSVERSNAYVVHSGYDYSPAGQVHKRQRDLAILEKDLADRPDHPFVLFNIGMTAYHMKDFPKAEAALQRCLAVSKPRESTIRKVYAMLAGCRLEQDDPQGARRWVSEGLSLFPRDPELLFRAGIIYRDTKELDEAERCFLTLLTARETGHIDSLDVTMTGYKAHHNLAVVYQDKGDLVKAENHFRQAIALEPSFKTSWFGLADIYRTMQRWDDLGRVEQHLGAAFSSHAVSEN
jgi:glycosyltransferase involved in cell wall biosynthesis